MHWKIALCSLSSGSNTAPLLRTACIKSVPDMTSASLLASRIFLPASTAARVGRKPAAPTMAATTASTSASAETWHKPSSPPAPEWPGQRRAGHPASPAQQRPQALQQNAAHGARTAPATHSGARSRSMRRLDSVPGDARSHPRRSTLQSQSHPTRLSVAGGSRSSHPQQHGKDRDRSGQTVDAVQHAAMTRQQIAAVLDPGLALEHAFSEVAHDRDKHDDGRPQQGQAQLFHRPVTYNTDNERDDQGQGQAAVYALPALARTDCRRQLALAQSPTGEVGTKIGRAHV